MTTTVKKLIDQALVARRTKKPHDAQRLLIEAVLLCRKAQVPLDLASTLTRLGQIERDLGLYDAALLSYQEAAAIYRQTQTPLALAHTIRHIGDIHYHAGSPGLAEPFFHAALEIYRGHPDTPPLDLANAIRSLAVLTRDRSLWTEARDLYQAVGVEAGVEESTRHLAELPLKPNPETKL